MKLMSPLAQGRGLKLLSAAMTILVNRSPLAQGRGLKRGNWGLCQDVMSRPSRRGVD